MKFIHLKPSDYVTSTWSGGTTTQVSIAPAGAVYADRDFLWRISSATVDLEVSDFTALPDYDRLIATLNGSIDVTHNDGDVIHLAPYHVHAFDGGWKTRSVGRCTDFNLMVRKGACTGAMTALLLNDETAAVEVPANTDVVVYCAEGTVKVEAGEDAVVLAAGESCTARSANSVQLSCSGTGKAIYCGATC